MIQFPIEIVFFSIVSLAFLVFELEKKKKMDIIMEKTSCHARALDEIRSDHLIDICRVNTKLQVLKAKLHVAKTKLNHLRHCTDALDGKLSVCIQPRLEARCDPPALEPSFTEDEDDDENNNNTTPREWTRCKCVPPHQPMIFHNDFPVPPTAMGGNPCPPPCIDMNTNTNACDGVAVSADVDPDTDSDL